MDIEDQTVAMSEKSENWQNNDILCFYCFGLWGEILCFLWGQSKCDSSIEQVRDLGSWGLSALSFALHVKKWGFPVKFQTFRGKWFFPQLGMIQMIIWCLNFVQLSGVVRCKWKKQTWDSSHVWGSKSRIHLRVSFVNHSTTMTISFLGHVCQTLKCSCRRVKWKHFFTTKIIISSHEDKSRFHLHSTMTIHRIW